ncbi:MAG TPA: prenyltransferase/squalene oxidase repeat-containing protein [Gemmataceae bacterium]|nr:prenyltransferase/squalene oxidase repeat-containing protein [Gemmataceae bacterium]
MTDADRLRRAYEKARGALLAERTPEGYWVGELSASALATATAVTALSVSAAPQAALIDGGLRWLATNQNADGGWGDTVKSVSNISTTMLCRAAFHVAGRAGDYRKELDRCEGWLADRYGRTPAELAESVRQRYGKDRTFSVPILMMCALAGLVPWKEVPRLPFELACLPQSWYRFARLPVVSYALPALIAIGQVVHRHRSTWNPITRFLRWLGKGRSLRVLEHIQPSNGGYLEATPLTSFVVMSLCRAARGNAAAEHVIARGLDFIEKSVRPDGSWPIDTNLSVWVTTLSVNALAGAGDLEAVDRHDELLGWLEGQQTKDVHPFTGAAAGAWGWSHLPGSVPDCDDTPGALIALHHLGHTRRYEEFGIRWMLDLQNSDGGSPTFCRGWGKLPFDRSGTDLTAHAMRAVALWEPRSFYTLDFGPEEPGGRVWPWDASVDRQWSFVDNGWQYLAKQQRSDGSWLPLWFGNQHAPDDINPVYGTARVLAAYRDLDRRDSDEARRGVLFLLRAQNEDGGWGGVKDTPSSVEETALAVEVLIDLAPADRRADVMRGVGYLVRRVEDGSFADPSPIGFYFAKLWYFEKLYPLIFTVAALGRAHSRFKRGM